MVKILVSEMRLQKTHLDLGFLFEQLLDEWHLYHSHHDDFSNLLLFNVADWSATKVRLQESAVVFQQAHVSRAGQWALVYVLRTTGDSDDARMAEVISRRDSSVGLRLFCRLKTNSSNVQLTYGRNKINADALSAWRAADNDDIKMLCFARLDSMVNDHDLAMEVLAAIRADRKNLVCDYVVDRRRRAEPAYRARAAMVAGLSPDDEWAISTIEMLKEERGFLQQVYNAANYAMERHQWSRHWAAQIREADNAVDVWRFTILLSKVVDGRFCSSEIMGTISNPIIRRFGSTLEDQIYDRIRKWKSKRQPKLFGMNPPAKSLIVGYRDPG